MLCRASVMAGCRSESANLIALRAPWFCGLALIMPLPPAASLPSRAMRIKPSASFL